jgi:TP901 family phage tail tape measure protein
MAIQEVKVLITTDSKGAVTGINDVSGALGGLEKQSKSTVKSVDKFTDTLAGAAVAAAAAFAAAFAFLSVKAGEFQQTMALTSGMLPGQTEEFRKMRTGILDISGAYGSMGELAKASYDAISGGVAAADTVNFLSDTAKFAKANMVEMSTAVDLVTGVLNVYGEKAGDTAKIMDTLTSMIVLGKGRGEEFSVALGTMMATGNLAGVSFSELTSYMVALTAQNVKATSAAASFNAIIANVATPTKDATYWIEKLNLDFNLAALQSKGLAGFMAELTEKVGNNAQAQKDLFGSIEAFKAIAILTSETGVKKFADSMDALAKKTYTADEAFALQQRNLPTQLENLKNAFEATFAKAAIPYLDDFAGIVQDNFPAIVEAFEKLVDNGMVPVLEGFKLFFDNAPAWIQLMGDMGEASGGLGENLYSIAVAVNSVATAYQFWFDSDDPAEKTGEGAEKLNKALQGCDASTRALIDTMYGLLPFSDFWKGFAADISNQGGLIDDAKKAWDAFTGSGEFSTENLRKKVSAVSDETIKLTSEISSLQIGPNGLIDLFSSVTTGGPIMTDLFNAPIKPVESLKDGIDKTGGSVDGLSAKVARLAEKEMGKVAKAAESSEKSIQKLIEKFDALTGKSIEKYISAIQDSDPVIKKINEERIFELQLQAMHTEAVADVELIRARDRKAQLEAEKITIEKVNAAAGDFLSILVDTGVISSSVARQIDGVFSSIFGVIEGIQKIGDATDVFGKIAGGLSLVAAAAPTVISVISSIISLFSGTDWNRYASDMLRPFDWATKEMTKRLAEVSAEVGDTVRAFQQLAGEFILDAGIKNAKDLSFWLGELHRMALAVNGGGDLTDLTNAFRALSAETEGMGYLGKSFRHLLEQIEGTAVSYEYLKKAQEAQVSGYAAFVQAGYSTVIIPSIVAATEAQKMLADNSGLISGIDGINSAFVAFANTVSISGPEAFANVQNEFTSFAMAAQDGYDALIAQGFSSNDSLLRILPTLQTLNGLHEDYGFLIDAETQALIDQAVAAGLSVEPQLAAQDRMANALEKLVELFETRLPAAMKTAEGAFDAAAGNMRGDIDNLTGSIEETIRGIRKIGDEAEETDERVHEATVGNTMEKDIDAVTAALYYTADATAAIAPEIEKLDGQIGKLDKKNISGIIGTGGLEPMPGKAPGGTGGEIWDNVIENVSRETFSKLATDIDGLMDSFSGLDLSILKMASSVKLLNFQVANFSAGFMPGFLTPAQTPGNSVDNSRSTFNIVNKNNLSASLATSADLQRFAKAMIEVLRKNTANVKGYL